MTFCYISIFNNHPCRICAIEVDEENSIIEHMEKEHGMQKVLVILLNGTTVCLNSVWVNC